MRQKLQQKSIEKLKNLGIRLIDQRECVPLVRPLGNGEGFWFGGGNLVQEASGRLLVSGRFRNHGDSRTGTGAGERGLEFAVFELDLESGETQKVFSLNKADISHGADVVSIEGGCLLPASTGNGLELFISTEKKIAYPKELINFQKPGTGVWSIDRLFGESGVESITAGSATPIVESLDPNSLHVKDPVAFRLKDNQTELISCNHSFSWSSSNTGLSRRNDTEDTFLAVDYSILPRGNSWDVACARITERLKVPRIGEFANMPSLSLYFYDGAECLRPLSENKEAARRPRGYSCEELGGLAWGWDDEFPQLYKISNYFPLFLSPYGTGCSRYISATSLHDGSILASWQQSQKDLSQPLVMNQLEASAVEAILK
jgi:hypothetical protein